MSTETPPRIVDAASLRISELAQKINWLHLIEERGVNLTLAAKARRAPISAELEGEAASDYLSQLIKIAEQIVLQDHNAYGSVRWLWYLRRMPDEIFAGKLITTTGYDRSLTESLSWYLTAVDSSPTGSVVRFRADAAAFRHTCRFVASAKVISNFHSLYRCVGKGATLNTTELLSSKFPDENAAESIDLYDARHDKSHELSLHGLGLASAEPDAQSLGYQEDEREFPLSMTFPCDQIVVTVKGPDGSGNFSDVSLVARHALCRTTVARILQPFSRDLAAPMPFINAVEPVIFLLMLIPILFYRIPWAISSTLQFGYFFIRTDVLKEIVDSWAPRLCEMLRKEFGITSFSTTYDEWRAKADHVRPNLWPLQIGGLTRKYGSMTMVDVTSSSNALLHLVEIDRTAFTLANERAKTFEIEIQHLIDASIWRPNTNITMVRGRTLRRNGLALTDIDALGVNERTLLLVSCKSLIYDREYDQGDFRVVRNAQTTVDNAVRDWDGFVNNVRLSPVGDNFDFSYFEEFIGVVCTPFVVYSSSPASCKCVLGSLRACASATELREWLSVFR